LAGGEFEKFMQFGAAKGNRNDRILRLVGSLVARGYSGADAATMALAMNAKFCKPALSEKEVRGIVKSVLNMRARAES
jgi:hypothetical protein